MSGVIGVILGVFAILSMVASVAAFFKANLSQKIIDTLKESNAALTERVRILEDQGNRDTARITALVAENVALQNYVSGTEAIQELAGALAKVDVARAAEHHDIMAAIQTIPMVITSHHQETLEAIRASIHTHGGTAA